MEIAILGLPASGKSTIFEIMTGVKSGAGSREKTVPGRAVVPDSRFDELVRIFKPVKISPAYVPFIDINVMGDDPWNALRQLAGGADGILHIVDAFTATSAAEVTARYDKLALDLAIADLTMVENKRSRLAKIPTTNLDADERIQIELLPTIQDALEAGKSIRSLGLGERERHALKTFSFWTLKPELTVINTGEGSDLAEENVQNARIPPPSITICARIESEIAALAAAERAPFLASMGIAEPAYERIIRTSFALMDRICYFTVGEDEVKAWVIPAGSTAPRAAAAIHKDFERGFIKAEVVSYDDFMACGRTIAAAKAAGVYRLEGKEYIVRDGDIVSFRFNV